MSCWYTMGQAVVKEAPSADQPLLRMQWSISSAVWNTLRVPGQCLSFTWNGSLIHGTLTSDTTTLLASVTLPVTADRTGYKSWSHFI